MSVLARQSRRESAARSYPRRLPIALASGAGAVVTDIDGRSYIDCLSGAGALPLGHGHPVVMEALHAALASGVPLTTLDLTTPVKDAFFSELFRHLPPSLRSGRVLCCSPSGADAVEAALKLCRAATGRAGVFGFAGGYHGMTQGALSVSGHRGPKAFVAPLGGVHHLPFPGAVDSSVDALRAALFDEHAGPELPAAIIAEPVQGEGGVNPMPAEFARALRAACTEAGVPLVLDEVQTGVGRTGSLWAGSALGIEPDVLVLSKAIGGGLPLALIAYREEFDALPPGAHAGTFRGNQLAFAAGAATLRLVVAERLPERAGALGARMVEALREVGGDAIVEVRGRGLMIGVQLASGTVAQAVQREMLARGVIVETGGREGAVLRFLPPLILSDSEADEVCSAFGAALASVALTPVAT